MRKKCTWTCAPCLYFVSLISSSTSFEMGISCIFVCSHYGVSQCKCVYFCVDKFSRVGAWLMPCRLAKRVIYGWNNKWFATYSVECVYKEVMWCNFHCAGCFEFLVRDAMIKYVGLAELNRSICLRFRRKYDLYGWNFASETDSFTSICTYFKICVKLKCHHPLKNRFRHDVVRKCIE